MGQGMLLLGSYALGLAIPFLAAAALLGSFLGLAGRARRWLLPLERLGGAALVVVGVMLLTGRFAALTAFLAQFTPVVAVGG